MKAAFMLPFIAGMLLSFSSFAQTGPVVKKAMADTTAPTLTVKFGPYADSAKVPSNVIKQIIKGELKVADAKGIAYHIIGFSFSWKRKDITDDFKTGVPKTIYLYNSVDIKADTHVPAAWQTEITNNVQPKEEFRFDEILVQSPRTKRLYKTGTLTLFVL